MSSAEESRKYWIAYYGGARMVPSRVRDFFTREYGEPFDAPPCVLHRSPQPCKHCAADAQAMRNGTYWEGVDLASGPDSSAYWPVAHDKHPVLRTEKEWDAMKEKALQPMGPGEWVVLPPEWFTPATIISNTSREGTIWGPPHVTPDTHAEWRLNNAPAVPWLPLSPGATRHKALPAICLELPSAACFMKGRGDE